MKQAPVDQTRAFDAIAKEFDVLRAEVNSRMQKQQDIANFAIAICVGFAAIVQPTFTRHAVGTEMSIRPLFPVFSIVLSAFALMTLDHEANIALLYRYMDGDLHRALSRCVPGVSLWQWNMRRAQWQHHDWRTNPFYYAMSWSKYVITMLPSFGFLLWSEPELKGTAWAAWNPLKFLAGGFFLATLIIAFFVGWQYHRMGKPLPCAD